MNRNDTCRTIGLVIDWAESPYHSRLVSGVLEGTRLCNVNLFVFEGGAINSPIRREAPRNIIYNFITSENLDGLIVAAGSLAHFISAVEFEQFLAKYTPLPIVTTSISVPGYPSVSADSRAGLRELLLHLVREHRRTRIAFIQGPLDNEEARIRFDVYKEVLEEVRIPFAQDLVVEGDFMELAGKLGVKVLLDERKVEFDALVASNDDMAMGAIEVITGHGLSIPGDVSVTGFDDLEIAGCVTPSLSTVHQPVFDLGKKAVELISRILGGETVPKATLLPSRCIIRESCGCRYLHTGIPEIKETVRKGKPGKSGLATNKCSTFVSSAVNELTNGETVDLDKATLKRLCTAYYQGISDRDGVGFLDELEKLLRKEKNITTNTDSLDKLLAVMKANVDRYLDTSSDFFYANRIWYEAETWIHELSKRELKYRGVIEGLVVQNLMIYRGDLTAAMNLDDFVDILGSQLEDIGITSCYLSLYEDDAPNTPTSLSRIIFGYGGGKKIRIEHGGRLFPSRKLVPDGLMSENKRFAFFVEPLFFGNTQLGFVLLEYSHKKGQLQDLIRRLFVNLAFNGAVYVHQIGIQTLNFEAQVLSRTEAITRANELLTKLYNERKAAENTVRRLNEELEKRVEERTKELEAANKALKKTLNKLKSTQKQLVQSEKMAALGSLVAGISHEINTPIGISVTAASHMEKKTNDLFALYKANNLKRTELEEYLALVLHASGMVLSNLKKSYEMIHDFKNIAVDQEHELRKTFDVKAYIEEFSHTMEPEINTKGHSIMLECEDQLTFTSYPGALNRILSLLISNSLLHGFGEDSGGTISLRVKRHGKKLAIYYSDNGIGIDKQNIKKIFAPFFTTKRSDGRLGLGLHIVFNLVTRTLGGRISCLSESGKGTTFLINIPDVE